MFSMLLGCTSTTVQSIQQRQIVAIKDGQITLSDGSVVPIPHYNDPGYVTFYCVRHAEKEKNTNDPDLTPEGRARAEKLGQIMDNAHLNIVATTNVKRTMQTGEAVRRWAGDPDAVNFPPDMQNSWLEDQVHENLGKHIFYVGHQNTIPQMLNQLTGTVQYKNIGENTFDLFYIAISKGFGQTEVMEFRY
jgi:phosphohistidine phosphatase SixA